MSGNTNKSDTAEGGTGNLASSEMDILAAQMGKASIASVVDAADAADAADADTHDAPQATLSVGDDKVKEVKENALVVTRKGKDGRPDVYIVDTADGIKALVQLIVDQASDMDSPLLYVDIEGVYLCRRGSISIIQLYMPPVKDVYLVDVHTLGSAAFKTTTEYVPGPLQNKECQTLRDIFESTSITKVFYDVRANNDALFNLFSVNLDGVYDLQLAEVATRSDGWERNNRFVNGLAKSIKADAGLTYTERSRFESIKTAGQRLFAPEFGGTYEVFNTRPMPDAIIDYCAGDVILLPRLYEKYTRAMTPIWPKMLEDETKKRVALARDWHWDAKSRENARKPFGW